MPEKNQGHKIRNLKSQPAGLAGLIRVLKSYKKYNYLQKRFLQITALESHISNRNV